MARPNKVVSAFTPISNRLREHAQNRGYEIAFTFLRDGETEERSLSFGALDRRARAIAQYLIQRNCVGKRALLIFRPGLDFVEAMFGCLYAGVIAVPAYPPRQNRNGLRIKMIAEDVGAHLVLTSAADLEYTRDAESALSGLHHIPVDLIRDETGLDWREAQTTPEQLAIVQYTSGSTGRPKGVVLSQHNITENCIQIEKAFEVIRSDVGVSWLPTYHDMGLVGHVLETVWTGQRSVLMASVAFLQNPVRWLKAISEYGAAISGGPNFAYELCVRKISDAAMAGVDLSSWQIAYNGSETVRARTIERFAERFAPYGFRREAFYPCYGMAESTLIVAGGLRSTAPTVLTLDADALSKGLAQPAATDATKRTELVSCGRAVSGDLLIVDPETRVSRQEGEVGELWLAGKSIALGYFEREEESSRMFHAHLAGEVGSAPNDQQFLRTGDLGFIHQGELYITGRIKDVIIVRGANRYPQDIEDAIESELAVSKAAAFSIDFANEERLVVVCEVDVAEDRQYDALVTGIRRAVTSRLGVRVDAVALSRRGTIPKTSSGKLQRFACKKAFLDDSLGDFYRWEIWAASPCEPTQVAEGTHEDEHLQRVMAIVGSIAGDRADHLSHETSLVELGLDSLERIEVASQLETEFHCAFSESELLHAESCGQLAELISAKQDGGQNQQQGEFAIHEFPEYQRLKRAQQFFARNQFENPYHRVHDGIAGAHTLVDGQPLVSFSTYNYLGLSGDPMVAAAAKRAIDQYGTSVSASRMVAGERPIHRQLETEIAAWVGTEDALVFVGGHSTNETTIGHLVGARDLIVHDELAHNSILQGALLSGAERRSFPHNDWRALDALLAGSRTRFRRVLIAIEGVYSMDGDYPDLTRFVEIRNRHRALLMVDEAHSLGTMGKSGRGIGEYFDVDPSHVDIWMGTLSKALGSCGGYIAGGRPLIELLRYTAPGFVYSVGMSPANAAAALAALHRLHATPAIVARCQANARLFREHAMKAGLNVGGSRDTPIIPVILGSSQLALELSQRLRAHGISVHPILYPAVPESAARLRFFVTAEHTEQQLIETIGAIRVEMESLTSTWAHGLRVDSADAAPRGGAVNLIDNSQLTRP